MKRAPLVVALVLSSTAAPLPAADLSERGTAMFDAMLGAMDAMGLVERGRKHRADAGGDWSSSALGSWGSGMPGASSFGGWPSSMPGFGMPGASPFGMPGAAAFGMPGASPFGMPGASAFGMPGASPFGGFGNPMSPWSSAPWSGGGMPWGAGGMPWAGSGMPWSGAQMPGMAQMPGAGGLPTPSMPSMPSLPWAGKQQGPASSESLEGAWEGQGGELLLIRQGMFRIYADAQTHRDGHLRIQGDRLQLRDADSGRTREYEMRRQGDQLALRTPEGDVLLYRRLSTGSTAP